MRGSGVTVSCDLPAEAYAAASADLPGIGPARWWPCFATTGPRSVWQRVVSGDGAAAGAEPGLAPSRLPGERGLTWRPEGTSAVAGTTSEGRASRWPISGDPEFPLPWPATPSPRGAVLDRRPGSARRALRGHHRHPAVHRLRPSRRNGARARPGRTAECAWCQDWRSASTVPRTTAPDGRRRHRASRCRRQRGGHALSANATPSCGSQVAAPGAVISEAAPGQPAQSWRFPARNRLIAGLSCAVVVVESHAAGGSMLTVAAAADRGIEVLAVPGPVNSPASTGTNQLLYEGLDRFATPATCWPPLAIFGRGRRRRGPGRHRSRVPLGRRARRRPAASTVNGSGIALPESRLPAPGASADGGPSANLGTPQRRVLRSIDRTPTADQRHRGSDRASHRGAERGPPASRRTRLRPGGGNLVGAM